MNCPRNYGRKLKALGGSFGFEQVKLICGVLESILKILLETFEV